MPSAWRENISKAAQVHQGGVVGRSRLSVDRYASMVELVAAAKSRDFHVIKTRDQVVLCNVGELVIYCWTEALLPVASTSSFRRSHDEAWHR